MGRGALAHRWDNLAFLHWPYEPGAVQRLLPAGLRPDLFGGCAWVGLVPFDVAITLPRVPEVPWASRFPEVNVRTYVRSEAGGSGVWFLSLDAARLGAVLLARLTYVLAYRWAKMSFSRVGDYVTYASRRRFSGSRTASMRLVLEVADFIDRRQLDDLDHFLTSRWRFYCPLLRRVGTAQVDHDPWPLRRARVLDLRQNLLEAVGLDPPVGDPVVHFSDRVRVAMSRPRAVKEKPARERPAPASVSA